MLIGTVAVLASCGSGGGDPPTTIPSNPVPATSTSAPGPTGPADPECGSLVASGQALVASATRFANGTATADQVRAAASGLSGQINSARAALGPDTSPDLDDASESVRQLMTALSAQPPDLAAVRDFGNDTLMSLRDAAADCQSTPSAN